MKFSKTAIRHLESLARIELGDEERATLAVELGRIVEFVEILRSVDTTGVEKVPSLVHLDQEHAREDEQRPGLDRVEVLRLAPDTADGFFRVPRAIERDDDA